MAFTVYDDIGLFGAEEASLSDSGSEEASTDGDDAHVTISTLSNGSKIPSINVNGIPGEILKAGELLMLHNNGWSLSPLDRKSYKPRSWSTVNISLLRHPNIFLTVVRMQSSWLSSGCVRHALLDCVLRNASHFVVFLDVCPSAADVGGKFTF